MDQTIANVGRIVRELRQARRMRVAELARETGYSAGYLSQVENGSTVPSLSALATLAAALDSDVSAFFPWSDGPRVRVSRAGDPEKLRMSPSASEEYTILSRRGPATPFTALVHRIDPARDLVKYRHPGERFVLLLSGGARLTIGGTAHDLSPGDALHYASHVEHTLEVTSDGPAELLWLVSPAIV